MGLPRSTKLIHYLPLVVAMFTRAIVRRPAESMINGLTEAQLGAPDYALACQQHDEYISALRECGLAVEVLDAIEAHPDSCFVEDVALITPKCAILTRPGAPSRQGEVAYMEPTLANYFVQLERIEAPGTIEAGDIMMVGDHYYIGLSARTNQAGAGQMLEILAGYGLTGEVVEMLEMLHLKTGLSYLENQHLLVCGEFVNKPAFAEFKRVEVAESASYSANSVWINDTVLVPAGFDKTASAVQAMGYRVREVAMSEFQKLDGGLSCLSLRF